MRTGPPGPLTREDLEAIPRANPDPDVGYVVPGWVLHALADEVLAARGRRKPPRDVPARPLPGQMDLPIFDDSP